MLNSLIYMNVRSLPHYLFRGNILKMHNWPSRMKKGPSHNHNFQNFQKILDELYIQKVNFTKECLINLQCSICIVNKPLKKSIFRIYLLFHKEEVWSCYCSWVASFLTIFLSLEQHTRNLKIAKPSLIVLISIL